MARKRKAFEFNGKTIAPGERANFDLRAAQLYTHTELHIPVEIIHGRQDGPVLLVCAAIHGDELNGVEIIRRLLKRLVRRRIKGTLMVVPIVNVFGFIHQSRYLPDRRDLNRCFPGRAKGSLAARIAHRFVTEILSKCTHAIDLHTGAINRSNLPQIRAFLDDPETEAMAKSFSVPIVVNTDLLDGSLRSYADENGISAITYEAGEAMRFDEAAIAAGVKGVLNVMRGLGMLTALKRAPKEPVVAQSAKWIRAVQDGIIIPAVRLGSHVKEGDKLATISAPLGIAEKIVKAPGDGIVIGSTTLPLVNEGEAIFNIAQFPNTEKVAETVQAFHEELGVEENKV
ncbi:MAG: succinylglutamate desuccinylase/aspartoacylase family protein, partial [Pseudomonadales bacterium]